MSEKKKLSSKEIAGLIVAGVVILAMLAFVFCSDGCFVQEEMPQDVMDPMAMEPQMEEPELNIKTYEEIPEGHPQVTITMEDDRQIKMELYPEYAPQTVANFVELAESGFYDLRYPRRVCLCRQRGRLRRGHCQYG